MKLELQSDNIEDYLKNIPPVIDFEQPIILDAIKEIESKVGSQKERARLAFLLARDDISHSFDSKKEEVTICACDVLAKKDGICFAKAHLLATLLRGMKIPTGFCYQRVLRTSQPDSGFALHGLNAIFLDEYGWFRVDPRGNKPGVDSRFSIDTEKLAYAIRPELGEVDYPNVFVEPLPSVVRAMQDSKDSKELFFKRPELI